MRVGFRQEVVFSATITSKPAFPRKPVPVAKDFVKFRGLSAGFGRSSGPRIGLWGPLFGQPPVDPSRALGRAPPQIVPEVWRRLRAAFVEVLRHYGQGQCDPEAECERLDRLFESRAASRERTVEHWNNIAMAREEQRLRTSQKEAGLPPPAQPLPDKQRRSH